MGVRVGVLVVTRDVPVMRNKSFEKLPEVLLV